MPTDSLSKQHPASLGLDGRDADALMLSIGRVHWILAEQAGDAALLSRQIITGFTHEHLAVLVTAETNPKSLITNLAPDAGPRELLLLSLATDHCNAFLKRAESELERAVDVRSRHILLALPTQAWASFGKQAIASWLRRIGAWLVKRRATLIIVSDGICDSLSEHLNQLSCSLAALASLNRTPSGTRLFLHFWHGNQGLISAREIPLERHDDRFNVSASSDIAPILEYSDQGRVHAERSVLEAAPHASAQWRLFDNSHELLQHALTARAASVLFAISKNEQADELAHQLNQLRRSCGNRLKLIVREIAPCLRYRDEQLLLSSGATLVVPFGTSLPRFLTLVESVQGHVWQRQLKDIDASLYGLKPLPICGQQSPLGFAEAVRSMWPDSVASGISHQLIRLQPVPGLSLSQVLSQTRLRRNGDIACIADKALYLFLFACRPESLDDALGNIFGVKWQELFLGLEEFSDLGFLLQLAFQSDIAPERDIPSPTSASAPRQVFKPRPLSLPLEARQ